VRLSHTPLRANSKSGTRNADEMRMHTHPVGSDRAALQHIRGTMGRAQRRPLWIESPAWRFEPARIEPMTTPTPREFLIQGVTRDGRSFRPSDWAERLAGAMSCFRPEGVQGGIGAFIGYSPLCVPRLIDGVKCVIVSEALKGVEPMAWDFVMSFARDNELCLVQADAPKGSEIPR
jgi:hypothetical protein